MPFEYRKIFANQVRSVRRSLNLTQEEVAEKAGIAYKYLGEIERQKANPTLQVMEKLALALERDLVELLILAKNNQNFLLKVFHNSDDNLTSKEVAALKKAIKILSNGF